MVVRYLAQAVAAYKAASAWSHFAEYLEYGDVNEDDEQVYANPTSVWDEE